MESTKPIKRVLVLADFACATGFAQVAQNVVKQLLQDPDIDYQIDVVGINYYGMPNEWQNIFPRVRLFPAQLTSRGDVFGRLGFMSLLSAGVYDLAWSVQDTFNIEEIAPKLLELRTEMMSHNQKPFKFIFYFPIDAEPMENWITHSVSLADIPVAYTEYAKREAVRFDPALAERTHVIPHGIDPAVFHPVPPADALAFRKHYFAGMADDRFLVTNVNRNQPRKDIARTLAVFALLKRQVPEAVLYLHMKANDVAYDLNEVARHYELIPDKDYILPMGFDENQGVDVEVMNMIYNASDVIMTTTLGEGWGLSVSEALACRRPVVAPDHTSLSEILADGRGKLVPAGKAASDWFIMQQDNARLRPLVSIPDFVDSLAWVRNHPDEAAAMAQRGYEHVTKNWTWDLVGEKWRRLFRDATTIRRENVVGRNDPCPCGSGKKYKHCHLNNE